MELTRPRILILTILAGFLLPGVLPSVGLDYPYFFITVIVLFAWFIIKWDSVKTITTKSGKGEIAIGLGVIAGDYFVNAFRGSTVGLIDLLIILLASVVFVFGFRALRSFWIPVAYGIILLAGYQIENYAPNYVALQDWLASVMAGAMKFLGIGAVVTGHLVTINLANGTPVVPTSPAIAPACKGS